MVFISCSHCTHKWFTKSYSKRVTCPRCMGKTKNVDKKELKQIIKNIIGI